MLFIACVQAAGKQGRGGGGGGGAGGGGGGGAARGGWGRAFTGLHQTPSPRWQAVARRQLSLLRLPAGCLRLILAVHVTSTW